MDPNANIITIPFVSILYQLSVTMEIDRRKQQGVGNDGESGMFIRSVWLQYRNNGHCLLYTRLNVNLHDSNVYLKRLFVFYRVHAHYLLS